MKEQTKTYLEKSRELLDQAEGMLRMGYNEPAGRTATAQTREAALANSCRQRPDPRAPALSPRYLAAQAGVEPA